MMRFLFFTLLFIACLDFSAIAESPSQSEDNAKIENDSNQDENGENMTSDDDVHKKQKLTVIGYASDDGPALHLKRFANEYGLELHLVGVNKPWGGFNDKIMGFYSFIESIDNTNNESIILVLDAYDTVPICEASDLLEKFNSFDADIVMSTGKDCWPDPRVSDFLNDRLSEEERSSHRYFPWFLCPNSGAIMGRHDAMLSMFRRVQKLVSIGNGSCNDFEGNKFGKNTQSDQRCYTTYYVESAKFDEYEQMKANETLSRQYGLKSKREVIDISKLSEDGPMNEAQSADGTVSKQYISEHYEELSEFYQNISMKLDYSNDLFLSMGGMMFMDLDVDIKSDRSVSMRSKLTNGSACVLHGNGPGVILWRSLVKQIENKGNLYIDDYVLRVGVDFFHWILWWIIMPCERLSHWLSITYGFDMGFHSTTFSEEVIWRFHVWTFVAIIIILGLSILYWYKYHFRTTMKVKRVTDNKYSKHKNKNKESGGKGRGKSFSFNTGYRGKDSKKSHSHLLNNNHPITQQLVKGLVNLEIMVHHNGNTFPLLKTQKKS